MIGAIDGCHVPLIRPFGRDADYYMNRKNFNSINVTVSLFEINFT